MPNPTPKSVIHHNPKELDNMRFLKKKRYAIPAVVAAGVLAVTGSAFAYLTTTGGGTGSGTGGTSTNLVINQAGVTVYNSLIDPSDYQWSLTTPASGAEIGNEITLAPSQTWDGTGATLSNVVVAMASYTPASALNGLTVPITLYIYNPTTMSVIAQDMQSFAIPGTVAGDASGTNPAGIDDFNVTFDFSSKNVVLPPTVVYGISYVDTTPNGLNVGVSMESSPDQVSVGSDTVPGTMWVSDVNPTQDFYGGANGEVTCSTVTSTFAQYSTTLGASGCGQDNYLVQQLREVPAVQFNTSGTMSDLYPGAPAQPLSLTVFNPGPGNEMLNTVAVTASSVSNGDANTSIRPCDPAWFSITEPPASNADLTPGETYTVTGAKIALVDEPVNQDNCEGATVNLTFTSS
jgi:hypothetical protein